MTNDAARQPPWVLVVDDGAGIRDMLQEWLKCSGVNAKAAADATDALKKVSDTPPHAVLIDMGHPDVDGFDLCRLLRERPDTHRTPIIGLTRGHSPDVQRALDAGCNVVFVKPCSSKYVVRELNRVLPSQFRAMA
jgi:CheY-like chemotaxis protein